MDTIAIDWSGAQARGRRGDLDRPRPRGQDRRLENGIGRAEVIAAVIGATAPEPRTVVGLDFAFAFPARYSEQRGWPAGRDIWEAMRDEAGLLAACATPFWGRPGTSPSDSGRRSVRPMPQVP